MTRIKMCGLMSRQELNSALEASANAVGFVVEIERSRHCLSSEDARSLIKHVPVFAQSVIVISPQDVNEAVRLAQETGADLLQIHGGLNAEEILALKSLIPQKIIAAVPPDSPNARQMADAADALLLDTFKGGKLGGSGEAHDWNLSAALARNLQVPVILAGGLNPSNVGEAVRKVKPYAVDVSSGVESDGRKDSEKMAAFVREVRSCL